MGTPLELTEQAFPPKFYNPEVIWNMYLQRPKPLEGA